MSLTVEELAVGGHFIRRLLFIRWNHLHSAALPMAGEFMADS
jgi:hypothetical protein